jgi:hypothetical protein
MYNRTLNRPMFRRGGRAGGGIMTGVQRPGYQGDDDNQLVEKSDIEKVQGNMESFNKAFPSYPYAASDFFMNLGSNILAQPGGQPIFQTIGTAAVPALQNLQKTRMTNTQGQRDLALQFWKSMDDDEKDAMINRAEAMVKADPERFPGGVKDALKVLLPTYRKDQSPQETEREDILRDEKLATSRVENLIKQYEIGKPDAETLDVFMTDVSSGKYEGVFHDPAQWFIEDDDVGRGTTDAEKRLVIKDYDPEQSDYKEGRVYIDFLTKIAYVKQGQFLIPYEDYISETISTD